MSARIPKAILLLSWILAIGGLAAISLYYSGESTRFLGIADDQEQTIRFTTSVEIVTYGFVSGEEVAAGDLIVEVRQPMLDAELQVVQEKIQALQFGNRENRASMESEVVQLQADRQAMLSALDSEIRNMRARQSAANNFLGALAESEGDSGSADLRAEIDSLRVRRQATARSMSARIDDLKSRLAAAKRPVDAQIAELENRQQELGRQRSDLTVRAQIDGQVGSVLFKVGETVPPFQPVLTVHGTKPTFVKGYIHENVLNGVQLGQSVWIRSSNAGQDVSWYEGSVESLGSRIVEFPERLKVNPMVQAWGREVIVRLQGEHTLLLGEKVSVQLDRPTFGLAGARAYLAELRR